jgi:hypothetical protein
MVVGFGFSPFFGDPFRFPVTVPGLSLRSTACDPAGGRRVRAAGGLTRDNVLVLVGRDQWVLPIHTAVPRRLAGGPDDRDGLMAPMKEGIPSQ